LQNVQKQPPGDIETSFAEIYAALLEGIMEINLPEKD
jgi:hypothetical protein